VKAAIFDYGAGNLHSLTRGLIKVGLEVSVHADAKTAIREADLLVLPGVGAFGHAMSRIGDDRKTMLAALRDGHPCVGICLGMQLFFPSSEEGEGEGIGLIQGRVTRLENKPIPHIGWTPVDGIGDMYFAHSYACRPEDPSVVGAWASHGGEPIAALVRFKRTVGVQFHPEKSSRLGLSLLSKLVEEVTS
jgi:glutamine amidotransferase